MSVREHVFIVGGGPAGLVAAIALRHKGFGVTVADGGEANGDKACGEGILPEGISALERLGIALDSTEGRAFRGIRFINARSSAAANFTSRLGLGMRRIALHRQFARIAEQSGATLLWRSPVTSVANGQVQIGARSFSADWIVGADGFRSQVRHWAGIKMPLTPALRFAFCRHYACAPWTDFVEVHWAANAQLYITPVSEKEIGVVVLSRNPRFRMKDAMEVFPNVAAKWKSCEPTTSERGAAIGNLVLPAVYSGRIALLGDASGAVDAITGEGLSLAFQQAEALADAIVKKDLSAYASAHARLRRGPIWMARLLLVLENQPRLQERVLQIFASEPDLFECMLAAHVGDASTLSLASLSARLGWRLLAAQ